MTHERGWAGIAQLVEYKLPKLGVASSNLVARSIFFVFSDACALRYPVVFRYIAVV